jgi:prevent-host-death family protein
MTTYTLQDAKTQLSSLLEKVLSGEEVVISRNGIPVAKLVPLETKQRRLGTYPILFSSNLLEPTDPDLITLFDEDS